MAKIGMFFPVAAKIKSYGTDGKPVYDAGIIIGAATLADMSFDTADAELYADDTLVESDTSITGYSGKMGVDNFGSEQSAAKETELSVIAYLTGQEVETGESADGYDEKLVYTGALPPYVGLGFIKNKIIRGVKKYEVTWCYKAQFKVPAESDKTKEKGVSYSTSEIDYAGYGIDVSGAEEPQYIERYYCSTKEQAKALLIKLANITEATTTSVG